MKRVKAVSLLRETIDQYLDNGGPLLGAALSFYTLLSVGPLLLLILSVARYAIGFMPIGSEAELYPHMAAWLEPQAAREVAGLIEGFRQTQAGASAGFFGSVLLWWSATRLLRQLQDALHQLWHVRQKTVSVGRNIYGRVQQQGMAIGMLLLCGAMLVLSVALASVAAGLRGALGKVLPGSELWWSAMTVGGTICVLTTLFALVMRILPAMTVAWRDAWLGASVTAVAFAATQYPLSYYLGHQGVPGFFGAAGSFVVFLVWVYYAAQLFFLGAQFTLVWAQAHGRGLQQAPNSAYSTRSPTQSAPHPLQLQASVPAALLSGNVGRSGWPRSSDRPTP